MTKNLLNIDKTFIKDMMQFDFIENNTRIYFSENDRERVLYKNGDEILIVDDGGGFLIDQDFLDRHDAFMYTSNDTPKEIH